jgi:hypothetical protein
MSDVSPENERLLALLSITAVRRCSDYIQTLELTEQQRVTGTTEVDAGE